MLSLIAYGSTLSGEFLWDDELQVVKNPIIRSLDNIPAQFSQPVWAFIDEEGPNRSNFYRPIQIVGYTLAYAIGELSPAPYHWISLGFHTLASLALYAVCIELGFSASLSLLGACLFAVHPVHVEAVAWIAATPDVTCGFFYFAALFAFLRSELGTRWRWWLLSAALFFVALLSKEMAVTLPVVVLLLTFRSGAGRPSWARRLLLLAPYGVFAMVYLALRVRALGFIANSLLAYQASYLDWITLGIRAFAQYVWLAIIPYPLSAYRMIPIPLANRVLPTLFGLALVVLIAVWAWKYRRGVPDAWLWYLGFFAMLTPVFFFKSISTSFVADRYLYIPSIAPILTGLALLRRQKTQTWIWTAWALTGVFTFMTVIRGQDWKSAERLYAVTLEQEPNLAEFHGHLAKKLLQRDQTEAALRHLEQALEVLSRPGFSQSYKPFQAHISMVGPLLFKNRLDEAAAHLSSAAAIDPDAEMVFAYQAALGMLRENPDYVNAIPLLKKAIAANPRNELTWDYLGMAHFNLGQYAEAEAAFQSALAVDPNFQVAQEHLAAVRAKLSSPF